ncbi:MAG: phage terminase large subunit [Methanosarcinaceae archaeon]|nr:phage terminase large subunit [Methanosarcinaceae archaeon]
MDTETNEIVFGGGVSGGKSFLGCLWLLYMCQTYPRTRWLMGRAILKNLKESTLKTFTELVYSLGWQGTVNINPLSSTITFANGSEIMLKDLFHYPSDPNFDSLGSTEYTGAFIDEASQISEKAKHIVMSRIRYKLDENGLVPKLLICSNPSKNWMYNEFYKPYKEGSLLPGRVFIQSLVGDNPNVSKHYINSLEKLDKLSKERLLYGNWEYDDDLNKLFKYDDILNMFTNTFVEYGERYITCDVARKGSDKCVIYLWSGLRVDRAYIYDISLIKQIRETINEIAETYSVPRSHIVIDEDGVGGGLCDELPGCTGFVNGSRALAGDNYYNLKSQCYFKLAQMVEENKVYFGVDNIEIKEKLIQDLEQITRKDADKDGKLSIIGKDIMKQNLGRSTDFSDALMMRMVFEVGVKEEFHVGQSLDVNF